MYIRLLLCYTVTYTSNNNILLTVTTFLISDADSLTFH